MGEQGIALVHDAAIGAWFARQRGAVDEELATGGGLHAQQHFQECGLAASRSADDGHELMVLDLQIDVLEHDLTGILLPQVLHGHLRHLFSAQPKAFARSRRSIQSMLNASTVIHAT